MRTQCRAKWLRLGTSAVALLCSSAVNAANSRVMLQVQSKSWVRDSTFDVEDFDRQCSTAGIELVSPAGADPVVGRAVILYTETKGSGFSHFGVGAPVGYGTNITYKLTLLDRKTSKTLVTMTNASETPAGLPVEQFHEGARQAFKTNPSYRLSCAAMAAALGSRQELLHLLPWAILDRQGAALVDKLGFLPETADERAYIALARGDFSSLRALESAAVEPLLVLFQNSRTARDGIGTFVASDADHARTLTRALATLAVLDDDRIPDVLVTFLNDYSDYRASDDAVVWPVLSETIRVLGRVGDVFTLPLLDEWQAGDSSLAKTAQAAAAALRMKLAK